MNTKTPIMTAVLFCMGALLLLPASLAENSDYYFRNMAVEDGLSQNMVYSILQDKTGFIWFGTLDGLNRYDGLRFKVFKKDNENDQSIGSNKIFSLLQDKNEDIWVGTANGIYIYNQQRESFSRFDITTTNGESVEGIVRDLKEDKKGNIWIGVQDKGVFCFTNEKKLILHSLENTNIRKIEFDSNENLWVATYGRGLLKINPTSSQVKEYLMDKRKMRMSENDINTILSFNSDYLLVGTVNKGVQKFDLYSEEFTPFLENHDGSSLFVRCMIKTENQEIWIGTEEGMFIYDLRSGRYVNIRHTHNDPYSLSDNAIHSLFQDREGGIWIGTFFGGVNYFNHSFPHFEKYYPIIGKNSISGKSISEFCEDDKKNIWIGTEDAGLNKFNPVTKTFTQCSITSKNIHSLLFDANKLWVGSFSDGLFVMDIITQKVTTYKSSSSTNSLKDDNIYSIYKDSSGKIWIGSMTGLQYYDEKSNNFVRVRENLIKNQVNDILEDYKGILWFATIGNGIFSYDRFSGEWQHYPSPVDSFSGDPEQSVICLLQDRKNRLWIGTEGAGISIFNRDTNSFSTAITSSGGLPNDVIYKLIEDEKGYIWGSTNKGIFRLDSENKDVVVYTHSNGLLGDQFNYKSGFKDYTGKIYFGGVKGFVAFVPDDLGINEYVPAIVLNSFQIQNKEVSLTEKKSPLNKSITYTGSVSIPHNASVFSIGFAALSYTYPNGNKYAYKLEGRDREWIRADQVQQVNYADLSPGNYVFKVMGANSDGVWNEAGVSLKINVLPPWYRTIWAYLFYIGVTGLLVYYSIHNFVRKTKRRNAQLLRELENTKEKELYAAKIEFFTHITHEIRTPLSLIKIPLEDVMKENDRHDPNWDNLTIIRRNVNRLLKLVNELMDFRKTESQGLSLNFMKTDVVNIIRDIIVRFKPSIDSKQIKFEAVFSIESLYADVDREVFTKILSNLFSNALKYSFHAIEVAFTHSEKSFEIQISNDGDRIPDQFVEKIFEPFFKLNKNMQGTGIGLAFVKSLVELHKGTIYCDNSKTGRTVFVMTLPINQEYRIGIDHEEEQTEKLNGEQNDSSKNELLHSKKLVPTILTVEDNEEFQQLLYKQLTKKYHVLQGRNGMEALDIVEKENVDVIICDIMMPVMDGLEFCRTLKENLKYSHIPIILLTAKTNIESKIEGINYGADEYIEKPYSIDYLTARIDNLLENRRKIKEAFRNSPELAYQSITHSKADEEFLQKLINIIHANLDEPNLNIDKLAEEMAVSRSTLYRKLNNVSELSPNDFILLIRLKKAAELIRQKKYQINEIAYMVGFTSPNYFSKCFSKQFGVLPKDF